MSLKIDTVFKEEDKTLLVRPIGEIDIYTSKEFKEELVREFSKHEEDLTIDGSKLEYIDSTGLGALISIYKLVKEKEKNIYIENIKPNIKKLFDITDLDKIFILKE